MLIERPGSTTVTLETPRQEFMHSYIEALKEGHICGGAKRTPDENIAAIEDNPQAFLDDLLGPKPPTRINELGLEVMRVPQTTLWLVEGSEFIGDARIRHHLSPELEKTGGHIGYGVRPSRQRQGYATEMLRLCLFWAREHLGLEEAMLTCYVENTASARVMEKNGGVLQETGPHPYEPERQQKIYLIAVPDK